MRTELNFETRGPTRDNDESFVAIVLIHNEWKLIEDQSILVSA